LVPKIGSYVPRKHTEGISTFASLRNTDYLYLWIGNLFNTAGLWIQQVTIGWLVWELSGSATLVGVASSLRFLPFLFIGPLGGVAADRMDRRHLLMITQTVMAAAAVLFAVVVAMDWVRVWHAMVFSFVMGCGFAMNAPVRQSLIANTVPLEQLGNAIALNAAAVNSTRIIGPAVGGVLIVAFGVAGNFLLQAGLYLCMVAVIFPMKVPYRDTISANKSSALRSLKEGLQYVWGNKTMFGLMMLSLIPSLFVMPILQIMPAFTAEVLHAKANIYGYLMTSFGVGALLATLTMASFGSMIRSGWLGIMALSFAGIFVILFSQSTQLWVAFILLAALGFSQLIFRVNNNTLVQTLAPDSLRGRVMAIYQIDHAIMPLSASALGVCADLFSVPTSIAISGILCLLIIGVLMASAKQIRDLRKL
jgi:MFS family permease